MGKCVNPSSTGRPKEPNNYIAPNYSTPKSAHEKGGKFEHSFCVLRSFYPKNFQIIGKP
jgi:hypothetical protein